VLWPLEDKVGNVRDVISTTGTSLDHRKLNSFGVITSQTGASVDYDQFFSGLTWDSDSQLYYARARWYDPSSGEFLGEDPLGFDAGDVNLKRYSNNDPINLADTSGLSWFSKAIDSIGDAFEDIGNFFEEQWDKGNIQKGLLVAGTLASGGMLGLGLATGASGMGLAVTGMQFASGVAGSYEALSGNRIGDGTFTRVLGVATALT
jgi:RHS repeat-associated protein